MAFEGGSRNRRNDSSLVYGDSSCKAARCPRNASRVVLHTCSRHSYSSYPYAPDCACVMTHSSLASPLSFFRASTSAPLSKSQAHSHLGSVSSPKYRAILGPRCQQDKLYVCGKTGCLSHNLCRHWPTFSQYAISDCRLFARPIMASRLRGSWPPRWFPAIMFAARSRSSRL